MKTARIIFDERSDPTNPGWFVRFNDGDQINNEDWALASADPDEDENILKDLAQAEAPGSFHDDWDNVEVIIE